MDLQMALDSKDSDIEMLRNQLDQLHAQSVGSGGISINDGEGDGVHGSYDFLIYFWTRQINYDIITSVL